MPICSVAPSPALQHSGPPVYNPLLLPPDGVVTSQAPSAAHTLSHIVLVPGKKHDLAAIYKFTLWWKLQLPGYRPLSSLFYHSAKMPLSLGCVAFCKWYNTYSSCSKCSWTAQPTLTLKSWNVCVMIGQGSAGCLNLAPGLQSVLTCYVVK